MPSDIQVLHDRFCDYKHVFKGNSPRTIDLYRDAFKSYLEFSRVDQIAAITKRSVETWILEAKKQRHWAPKTIKERLKAFGQFCLWLKKEGYLAENPVEGFELPKLPKQIPRHLPLDQAELLMQWTRNYPYAYPFEAARAEAIIAVFLYTGIRKSELRNLGFRDVDIRNRVLTVRGGKGGKDRMIPLNPKLFPILERYLKERKRLGRETPYFFVSMRSNTKISACVIDNLVVKLREKSGIHFSAHKLRHTFAVLMLEGECNLFALKDMMGHSDIKTTAIYLAATTAHLQSQMNKHPL